MDTTIETTGYEIQQAVGLLPPTYYITHGTQVICRSNGTTWYFKSRSAARKQITRLRSGNRSR